MAPPQALQIEMDFGDPGTRSLSQAEHAVLEEMEEHAEWSSSMVKREHFLHDKSVCTILRRLVAKGFLAFRLEPVGRPGRAPRIYWMTPLGKRMLAAVQNARGTLDPSDFTPVWKQPIEPRKRRISASK